MKKSRIIALIMAIALILSSAQIFAFAGAAHEHEDGEITVIFNSEVSPEVEERVIAHFHGDELPVAGARGLTCTLFGHKLDTGTTYVVTHKARATAPRCLQDTVAYEICTRCDYAEYTTLSSVYIYCCS